MARDVKPASTSRREPGVQVDHRHDLPLPAVLYLYCSVVPAQRFMLPRHGTLWGRCGCAGGKLQAQPMIEPALDRDTCPSQRCIILMAHPRRMKLTGVEFRACKDCQHDHVLLLVFKQEREPRRASEKKSCPAPPPRSRCKACACLSLSLILLPHHFHLGLRKKTRAATSALLQAKALTATVRRAH